MYSLIITSLIALALLCGCNTDSDNKTNTSNLKQVKISTKEQLKIGVLNLDTLDPITTKNKMVQDATRLIYSSLVDIDSTYRPQYNLINDIKTVDNLEWTISLKKDIKWSDGQELVATDVYKAIDYIMNSDSIYSVNTSNIKAMNIINNYNLKIDLNQNDCFFTNKLNFPIVKINTLKEMIGTGPYKIESREENNILLSTNNFYKGKVTYKKVKVNLYDNQDSILREFKNNQIDVLELPSSAETNNLVKVYKSDTYQDKNFVYIGFNMKNKYLRDINIRQAISYAINKDTIINNINNKTVSNANLPIPQSSYLYPKSFVTVSYDPNKSIDMLQNLGWNTKSRTSQSKYNRLQFSLLINGDNPIRKQEAQSIKNDLDNVGIKINIVEKSYDNYIRSIKYGGYDMVLGSYSLSMYPDILFDFYSKSKNNYTYYNNPQYDLICERTIKTQNVENDVKELSDIIINDSPIISLYFSNDIIFCGKDINIYPKGSIWCNYNYIINN